MTQRKNVFEILRFFFKGYKLQVVVLLILSLLVGGLEAATVATVYPILNVAFTDGIGEGNIVLSIFKAFTDSLPIIDEFIAYCLLFMILAVLAFVVKAISVRYRAVFISGIVHEKQNEILKKFLRADYQYFIDHKEGELIYNTTSAPGALSPLILATTELVAQALLSISILLLLFSLSWPGTMSVLFVALLYYFLTRYLAEKVSYISGREQADAGRETIVVLNEAIGGIKQVKVFTNAADWVRRFNRTVDKYWHHTIRLQTWQQILNPGLMLILYLSIGIVAVSIRMFAPASFSELIPVFGTFAFAVFRLVPVITIINNSTLQIMAVLPNCEVVYRILGEDITKIKDGDKELDSFMSSIEFDKVTFAYKGRANILINSSTVFEKGKTTAIVGRSGSGKTTIINLILRLFDVEEGKIIIDGSNIKQYHLMSWLNKIGYVSQDTFIFNDTVKNNITFGSNYTDEEIIKASEYASAHTFISEFPEGYDTLVGDKGMKLSGGQKQRIAVARAMIRNPEVLIFDEATNALDNISEAAVQNAIDEISKNHTVIVIAHRLSTIVNADKIVVLGDGEILEEGTHEELLARGGAYNELYQGESVRRVKP